MKRNAFRMKILPGCAEEYKKRHDEVWPELSKLLTEAGISDYSIHLDEETNYLFAYQMLTDDNIGDDLPKQPLMQKWWKHMADIMETNPDNSPVVVSLKEVFYMK
jgi:L-rhamnose mutarotase